MRGKKTLRVGRLRVYRMILLMIIACIIFISIQSDNSSYETPPGKVKRIILVAYPRSGSSFTGSLLSSRPDSFYFYEPLKSLNVTDLNDPFKVSQVFNRSFSCNFTYTGPELGPRSPVICKNSSMIVIKVIRLRLQFLFEWLNENRDVKIIHLVRDPRAIVTSAQKIGRYWLASHAFYLCTLMKLNLEDFGSMYRSRYRRISYEDLYSHPESMMSDIFKFLGEEIHQNVIDHIDLLTNYEEHARDHLKKGNATAFMNVKLRTNKNWDPNEHWKERDTSFIRSVENSCSGVMEKLGYSKYIPNEKREKKGEEEEEEEELTEEERKAKEIIIKIKEATKKLNKARNNDNKDG